VLDSVDVWDDVTAGVVLARLAPPKELSYFTPAEAAIAGPLLDLLLAQDSEPRVPVLALIDERLAIGETDGWHYEELPEDAAAWRASLNCLDEDARTHHSGRPFAHLITDERAALIQDVQDRAHDQAAWHDWPAEHVWSLWTRYACTAFYSHPWAWNEIGFPGPAYPRGYVNPGINSRDRWETK
jgi:Gluconate 2-dehydrogenase subunit 3